MALLIDMIILLLLVGTLAYAFLVDRRVRALMDAMRALEPVVDQFSSAVDRTENSVRSLRAEGAVRAAVKREDEPPLTRTARTAKNEALPKDPLGSQQNPVPDRATAPEGAQLPPGMARVTGKAELVRSFFDTVRSREA